MLGTLNARRCHREGNMGEGSRLDHILEREAMAAERAVARAAEREKWRRERTD